MDFGKLSAADRRTLIVAAVVVVTGVASIIDDWGGGAVIGLLAGAAAAAVILLPQLAPATRLPAPKGLSLLVTGGLAAIGFVLAAIQWSRYLTDFGSVYSILFDVGLVASIVLLWFGWTAYQAESKSAAPTA